MKRSVTLEIASNVSDMVSGNPCLAAASKAGAVEFDGGPSPGAGLDHVASR